MTDVYTQHEAAFSQVSSYAILKGSEHVAKVAFKFPRDGAGLLTAYVHWIGTEMVRGSATGYGYDKRTAAVAAATAPALKRISNNGGAMNAGEPAFWHALQRDAGPTWNNALRDAGFTVFQTV